MTQRLKKHHLKLNIALRESSEILATSFNFNHCTRKLTWLSISDKPKSVTIFRAFAYQGKVRITNHNNDNTDNPVRKRLRFSRYCVATSTCRYDTEIWSRRVKTVCALRFCVLSRKRILLLYSLKSNGVRPVLACVATHRFRQKKPLHFSNWISIHDGIHELKMESYLLRYDDQLSLTHLAAQTEVVHSLVQKLWNSFSDRSFVLALISPWYAVNWLRYLSIICIFYL